MPPEFWFAFSVIMLILGALITLNIWYLTTASNQLRIVKKGVNRIGEHLQTVDEGLMQVVTAFRETSEKLADYMTQLTEGPDDDEEGGGHSGGDEGEQEEEEPEADPNPNINDQGASAFVVPVPEQNLQHQVVDGAPLPSPDWNNGIPFEGLGRRDINPEVQWLYADPAPGGLLVPQCAKPGCKHSPTHYLKLLIDHDPTDNDRPDATILVGVGLCLQHLIVPVEQVVQRCADELASIGIFQIGRDAVSLQAGMIGDTEWESWLAMRAVREGGGRC